MRHLMPHEPEVSGLLALMLHCQARVGARRVVGAYVPLSDQDVSLWSHESIDEADALLLEASRLQRLGRFQLEAAIQSAHARRRVDGSVDWDEVVWLYEGLVRLYPTLGALVGQAAALVEARGLDAAEALLARVSPASVTSYQPYWALRAHLQARAGRRAESVEAYERAIGLCDDEAMRRFLLVRRDAVAAGDVDGRRAAS